MRRPGLEVADIFHHHGAAWRKTNAGHVSLEGVVDSQADKDAAGLQANQVPGGFSVQNNLQVVARKK